MLLESLDIPHLIMQEVCNEFPDFDLIPIVIVRDADEASTMTKVARLREATDPGSLCSYYHVSKTRYVVVEVPIHTSLEGIMTTGIIGLKFLYMIQKDLLSEAVKIPEEHRKEAEEAYGVQYPVSVIIGAGLPKEHTEQVNDLMDAVSDRLRDCMKERGEVAGALIKKALDEADAVRKGKKNTTLN